MGLVRKGTYSWEAMHGPCEECQFPLLLKFVLMVYEPGDTPLMFAAYHGHLHCVEAWVNSGADVNSANSVGDTALIHAGQTGQRGLH